MNFHVVSWSLSTTTSNADGKPGLDDSPDARFWWKKDKFEIMLILRGGSGEYCQRPETVFNPDLVAFLDRSRCLSLPGVAGSRCERGARGSVPLCRNARFTRGGSKLLTKSTGGQEAGGEI